MWKAFCTRHALDVSIGHHLDELKYTSMKNILSSPILDVAYNCNVSILDFQAFLLQACSILAPARTRISEMDDDQQRLKTTLSQLDHCLHGGIAYGQLTEVAGTPGVGKSQFCMMLSGLVLKSNRNHVVIYIDTEQKFCTSRFLEMLDDDLFHPEDKEFDQQQNWLNRIQLMRPKSSYELTKTLKGLESLFSTLEIGLIVIDSIAILARRDFDTDTEALAQRQKMLTKQANILKYLAGVYEIPVIAVNQASQCQYSVDGQSVPTLGNTWSHCVNTRLIFQSNKSGRTMRIAKSPISKEIIIPFAITKTGLVETTPP